MRFARHQLTAEVYQRMRPLLGDFLFSTPAFVELWEAKGGKGVCWITEENGQPVAALFGVEFGVGPLRRFQAMPDGLYCRFQVVPERAAERPDLCRILMSTLAGAGYLRVHLFDYHDTLVDIPEFDAVGCETTVIDITAPDWEPPDRKLRSEIRKAEREGIQVVAFEPDRRFSEFLELVNQTEQRAGRKPRYSDEFFRRLARLYATERRIDWVWCELQGQPVAGHIYFIEGDMLLAWQVYSDRAFSSLKPNQYILYTTARKWAARGIRFFNLGSTPESAAGVIAYKSKWGGQQRVYRSFQRARLLGRRW